MTYQDKGSYESSPPCTGRPDFFSKKKHQDRNTMTVCSENTPPPKCTKQIVKFLGTSSNSKPKSQIWICTAKYWGDWVSGFGGFRGCSIFSGDVLQQQESCARVVRISNHFWLCIMMQRESPCLMGGVLQLLQCIACVAVCCSVLQSVAVCCSVLQCVAVCAAVAAEV